MKSLTNFIGSKSIVIEKQNESVAIIKNIITRKINSAENHKCEDPPNVYYTFICIFIKLSGHEFKIEDSNF